MASGTEWTSAPEAGDKAAGGAHDDAAAAHKLAASKMRHRWNAVASADYYHGYVPAGELDELLVKEGDFLLRLVRPKQAPQCEELVITLMTGGAKHNIGIHVTYQGYFSISRLRFKSIADLVFHFCNRGDALPNMPPQCTGRLRCAVPANAQYNLDADALVCDTVTRSDGEGAVATERASPIALCGGDWQHQIHRGRLYRPWMDIRPQRCAIKSCPTSAPWHCKAMLLHEYSMLRKLHHSNIVTVLGMVSVDEPLQLVTSYAEHTSLRPFLTSGDGAALRVDTSGGQTMRIKLAMDACRALSHLEKCAIVHTRVGAHSCLVDNVRPDHGHTLRDNRLPLAQYESYKLVLSGFSRARSAPNGSCDLPAEHPVSSRWAAPELLAEPPTVATFKCDMWSLGVLLWELCTDCEMPYGEAAREEADVRELVDKGERLAAPQHAAPGLAAAMLQCWDRANVTYDDVLGTLQADSYAPWL